MAACVAQGAANLGWRRHRFAADLQDDVSQLEPLIGSEPGRIDAGDHDALLSGTKNAAGGRELQAEIVVGAAATPCRLLVLLLLPGLAGGGHWAFRKLAESGDDALLLALAQHADLDRRTGREGADRPRQLRAAPDRRAVDGGDNVTRGDAGLGGRPLRFRGGNERAVRLRKAERFGEV